MVTIRDGGDVLGSAAAHVLLELESDRIGLWPDHTADAAARTRGTDSGEHAEGAGAGAEMASSAAPRVPCPDTRGGGRLRQTGVTVSPDSPVDPAGPPVRTATDP